MEGVVISAKKAGSTVTVSVISDADGKFSFPAGKLEPGQYTLKIRAVGYDLEAPKTVDVGSSAAPISVKLRKTRNLAAQLTSGEWTMSAPGTPDQKAFLDRCTSCHTLERPMKSTYDAEQFIAVLQRMGSYAPGTTPLEPLEARRRTRRHQPGAAAPARRISRLHQSQPRARNGNITLKTLPRLKGRSTRVVITEYDLPRPTAMPHDVILDPDGIAWYTDFGHQFLGKLDPKSGRVTEYTVPTLKPGFPAGVARYRDRQEGRSLGRPHAAGGRSEVRPAEREVHDVSRCRKTSTPMPRSRPWSCRTRPTWTARCG